jgi:predicted nucleic acid-binding protein
MASDELLERLRAIARREGRPLAEVIREGLEWRARQRPPRPRFIAAGASELPPHDAAARSDEARYEPRVALICDTGPLYAAIDRRDEAHAACAALLGDGDESLVIPAPVIVEVDWLVASRLTPAAFDAFLASIEDGALAVAELEREDYPRIRHLCRRYADLPLGFVDAAVVAIAERFGERKLASLDRSHLGVVRPRHVRAFTLLPA